MRFFSLWLKFKERQLRIKEVNNAIRLGKLAQYHQEKHGFRRDSR